MFALSVMKYAEYCLNIAQARIMKNFFLSVIYKRRIKNNSLRNALEIEGKQTFVTKFVLIVFVNIFAPKNVVKKIRTRKGVHQVVEITQCRYFSI